MAARGLTYMPPICERQKRKSPHRGGLLSDVSQSGKDTLLRVTFARGFCTFSLTDVCTFVLWVKGAHNAPATDLKLYQPRRPNNEF